MKPIAAVFMPWWGPAPGWERQFMERAADTKCLSPILVGDAAEFCPDFNALRIPCTMNEFESFASEIAGVPIHKCDPRYFRGQAICELRPMMAEMFAAEVKPYEFWGYGDWDCVWGDWDSYLTEERLAQYDAISSCSYTINGSLQLFRNAPEFTQLYRKREDILRSPNADGHLDESGMQEIVVKESWVRCLYPVDMDSSDRAEVWPRCLLKENKLYRANRAGVIDCEILNFHFPGCKRWPL